MLDRHAKRDAAALRNLLDVAVEAGLEADKILNKSELSSQSVYTPEAEIETWQELAAIENLMQDESWRSNALISASRLRITSHGTLGYAMLASSNLLDAIKIASRFRSVSLWLCEVTTRRVAKSIEFSVLPHALPQTCQDYCAIRGVASLKVWAEDLLGRQISPTDVRLKIPRPEDLAAFDEHFGCEVEFEAGVYSIAFPLPVFKERLRFADPWICQSSQSELRKIRQQREPSYANRVKDLILDAPKTNGSERTVASALKISGSTLRRRLREEGTTFREIRADTLHAMACILLAGSSKSVDEISYQLGYSEAASFVRSFRRQENISPGAWRKAQRVASVE